MMDRWRDKRNSCGTVCKGSNAWRYYCVQTLGIRGMSDVCVACIKTQACPLVVQITYNTARSRSDLNLFAFQGNVKKQHIDIQYLYTIYTLFHSQRINLGLGIKPQHFVSTDQIVSVALSLKKRWRTESWHQIPDQFSNPVYLLFDQTISDSNLHFADLGWFYPKVPKV